MAEFTYGFDVTVEQRSITDSSRFATADFVDDVEHHVEVRLATELVHELDVSTDYTDREAADLAIGRLGQALNQLVGS